MPFAARRPAPNSGMLLVSLKARQMSIAIQRRCLSCARARHWVQTQMRPRLWAAWPSLLFAAGLALLTLLSPPICLGASVPPSPSSKIETISFMENGMTTASLEPKPAPIKSDSQAAALFGMETQPLIAGTVQEKWTRAKAEIAVDLETVAHCRANGVCPAVAQKLIDLTAEGAGRTGRARVGLINRAVDLAIRPTSDEVQWGVADRWSAPFETLRSGRGDCEDYAIVKYLALLEAGLSEDDMRIVILKRDFPNEDHAVLAVRVDGDWLILDNRTLTLVRDTDLMGAMPEFVLDRSGVRRFVSRGGAGRMG